MKKTSVKLTVLDTAKKNRQDPSRLQQIHTSDIKTQIKQTQKTNKIKLRTLAAISILILLAVVPVTLIFIQQFHLRDNYTLKETTTYPLPNSNRYISTTLVSLQHKPWFAQPTKTQAQLITLPSSNPSNSATPLVIAVNNQQAGISLKKLGDSNYFLEVDPIKFVAYYQKNHPVETKRLLGYLHLSRNLADGSAFDSEQLKQKIIQSICQITHMDPHSQKSTLKQMDYHIATSTDKGFVLEREPPKSSRLLQHAQSRQLYFYDMYLAYMMAARAEQMIDAAEQIQKAQQQQQKEKGQQPVTVITVINIVNNSNVVINLNSSNNVIINNNNNKEVNIVKGNNEPVINNNTQVQNNNHSQVQSNTNNQPQTNTNKRMLTEQGRILAAEDTQPQGDDDKSAISKAAFEYSTLCSDIDGAKHCPVGYFHNPSNPFKLAASQQQKGVSDLKVVRRIVIGSRILLNLDQLVKSSQGVGGK